jgi:hypothetical protein
MSGPASTAFVSNDGSKIEVPMILIPLSFSNTDANASQLTRDSARRKTPIIAGAERVCGG